MNPPEESPICECTHCRKCDGEGCTFIAYTQDQKGNEYRIFDPVQVYCATCDGTGLDREDCSIHADPLVLSPAEVLAFDPRFGITAEQLGVEDDMEHSRRVA